MKLQIILGIILMLSGVFFEQLDKLNNKIFGRSTYGSFDNEKLDKIATIIARIFLFSLGLFGLIYEIFLKN